MQSFLSISIAIYLFFYVFEGLIRHGLHMIGADSLIFVRDIVLLLPILMLLALQCHRRRLHPAFYVYIFVIVLHGTVMMVNIGSYMAVIYSAKMLITMLAGALVMPLLMRPGRRMLCFVFLLWVISWGGVLLEKYYMTMPWMGMEVQFGDVSVEISRDWQIEGEDKRAGGFMRSSIHAATVMPLLALMLAAHLRSVWIRLFVALATAPLLVWTTQKGPIIGYALALGFLALWPHRPIPLLRLGVLFVMTLMVALPIIMPHYQMPVAEHSVFSLSSFYLRVEEMWPQAWEWIGRHSAFPFGVGLGGISGAQRMYALHEMNAADNMFILMYAYFGVMSFVYLGYVAYLVIRADKNGNKTIVQALSTLVFLFGYGCVISLLEDQMASMFLGASIAALCADLQRRKKEAQAQRMQQGWVAR